MSCGRCLGVPSLVFTEEGTCLHPLVWFSLLIDVSWFSQGPLHPPSLWLCSNLTSPGALYTLKGQHSSAPTPCTLPPCSPSSPRFIHWTTPIPCYSLQHDGGSGCGLQSTACHDLIGSPFSFLVAHKIRGHLTARGILNEMK